MDFLKKLLEEGKITPEIAQEIEVKFKELQKQTEELKKKYEETQKTLQEVTQSKAGLESELQKIEEKIQKAKEEGKAELVKELEKEKAEKQELMQKLQNLESKNKELTINTELSKVLDEVGVVDKEVAALALKHFVDVSEDGKVVFKNGEEVLDLSEGAKKFFENKPHLLGAKGQAGSGAGQIPQGGAVKKRSEMSVAEKAEYIATHGKDAYLKLPE